jgi:hypothetical protein
VKGKQAGVDRLEGDSELGTRLGMQRGEAETLTRNTLKLQRLLGGHAVTLARRRPFPKPSDFGTTLTETAAREDHNWAQDAHSRGNGLGAPLHLPLETRPPPLQQTRRPPARH